MVIVGEAAEVQRGRERERGAVLPRVRFGWVGLERKGKGDGGAGKEMTRRGGRYKQARESSALWPSYERLSSAAAQLDREDRLLRISGDPSRIAGGTLKFPLTSCARGALPLACIFLA